MRRTKEQKNLGHAGKWRAFNRAIHPTKIPPSMHAVAKHMGIQRSYLCLIMNGHRPLTTGLAKAIGMVFGVKTSRVQEAVAGLGVSKVKKRAALNA